MLNDSNNIYNCDSCCEGYHILSFTKILDILDIVFKSARKLWNRDNPKGNKAYELDHDIMEKEYKSLWDGVQEGAKYIPEVSTSYDTTKLDTVARLRINLVTFVAFKNYQQKGAMIKELIDNKGNIRSWNSFRTEVRKISNDFNENWLKAEYNAAVSGSQAAVQWQDFEKNKHIFPYLQYKSQADGKVRPTHVVLHNVIRHIDSPFWNTYYPPNGWMCRCYVLQKRDASGGSYFDESKEELSFQEHPAVFRFNPGKEKKIFNKNHPYFTMVTKNDKAKVLDAKNEFLNGNKLFFDQIGKIKMHVSNYYANSSYKHELQIGELLCDYFRLDSLYMNTQIGPEGQELADFYNDDLVIEYKNTTTLDFGNLYDNVSKAHDQVNQKEHQHKSKYIILRIEDKIDEKRLLGKIFAKKSGFNLFFINKNVISPK